MGLFGVNEVLTALCFPCSSCDPSTDTETRSQFYPFVILIEDPRLFFILFDLIFLVFLLYSPICFEEVRSNTKDISLLDDVCI